MGIEVKLQEILEFKIKLLKESDLDNFYNSVT